MRLFLISYWTASQEQGGEDPGGLQQTAYEINLIDTLGLRERARLEGASSPWAHMKPLGLEPHLMGLGNAAVGK